MKNRRVFSIVLTSVVTMIMMVFISCGNKQNETDNVNIMEQTGTETNRGNESLIQVDIEGAVQEPIPLPFDYNHEYNKMLRCYEDKIYLAGADGIYCIKDDGVKELIFENSYNNLRGMEIYQDSLYFCGSAPSGEKDDATIYRMDLNTHEVEDALASFSELFVGFCNISIYEDKLYVAIDNGKRLGFELNEDGEIIKLLEGTEADFLFKEHNECIDLEQRKWNVAFDSEEYANLVEESKERYYSVMDVAACKKLLQGNQVVRKYKDEMYTSLYLEKEDGTYEFLCDIAYSWPLLVTESGVYYPTNDRGDIGYVDYATKTSKQLYTVEGTDEVNLINYDADYIYLIKNSKVGWDEHNYRVGENYLLRIPREGGEAETVYQFEGDLQEYGSLTRCAVYGNHMFFELHEPISLDGNAETSTNDASADVAKTYVPKDYGQIVELREEFTGESVEEITFYYEMENFYVNDTFENADKINNTLQKIYDEYEQSYIKEAEVHKGGYVGGEPISTPHDSWHLLKLTLVGEQYISIQYNNIDYMGGAHPYSHFDGITIDCKTGEEVSASELLGKSDDEILQQVSKEMGMDIVASWDEIDYYLTDSTIVFFYRMGPLYWDDVVWSTHWM